MKSSDSYTLRKPISIGSGDQTYGVVTLTDTGALTIDGNAARITRLLASRRRLSFYRGMTNEQFFALLPEALWDGLNWAEPVEERGDAMSAESFNAGQVAR
jgi:hypothetical protein